MEENKKRRINFFSENPKRTREYETLFALNGVTAVGWDSEEKNPPEDYDWAIKNSKSVLDGCDCVILKDGTVKFKNKKMKMAQAIKWAKKLLK